MREKTLEFINITYGDACYVIKKGSTVSLCDNADC